MDDGKVMQVRADGVGDEERAVFVGIGQDHHELLAAIAGGKVGGPLEGVAKAAGH
jgi:hypothetical protein